MGYVAPLTRLCAGFTTVLVLGLAPVSVDAAGLFASCKADLDKLCGTVAKGGERRACLIQNESKLADDCRASLKDWQATRAALQTACKTERETLCKDAKGGAAKCLRENLEKVSKPCADALAAASNG